MACKPVDPGLLAHIHALGPPFYLLRRPEFRTTTGAPWVGEESMKLCVQKTSPGSTSLPSRYRGGSRRCIRTCEAPHLRGGNTAFGRRFFLLPARRASSKPY